MVKNLPALRETQVWSLGQEVPLERDTATHASILAWKIPWTEEPGGLQFIGSQRVGWHDWVSKLPSRALHLSCTSFLLLLHQFYIRSSGVRSCKLGTYDLKYQNWNFPGSPEVKTYLLMQRVQVQSMLRELGPHMPQQLPPKAKHKIEAILQQIQWRV